MDKFYQEQSIQIQNEEKWYWIENIIPECR